MPDDFLKFRSVQHFNEPLIANELENGLKAWTDHAFLKIGGFVNVTIPTSGIYGNNFHVLHEVDDPSYGDSTIFQSIKKDWVYETGVSYTNYTGGTSYPLPVKVYVDGNLKNTGDSGFEHHINYSHGCVVFNSNQSEEITCQYSYRSVQVYTSSEMDINGWMEINTDSFNPANIQWAQNLTSGDYSTYSSNRAQLPCIIIETAGKKGGTPFELGTLASRNKYDLLFHVISQDRYTRNNIVDILSLQENKTIILYDSDLVFDAGLLPLDERGMKVNNNTYPDLLGSQYVFRTAYFEKISVSEVKTSNPNLHFSIVRAVIEVIY